MEIDNKNLDFLQSEQWRKFQENVGRKTFFVEVPSPPSSLPASPAGEGGFSASIVEHELPVVGKYFYVPRGPLLLCHSEHPLHEYKLRAAESKNLSPDPSATLGMTGFKELVELAKKNKIGWIRIDPNDSRLLDIIRVNSRVVKAPHDMQPKEIFVMDITKSEEELLAEMKSKTRYNIKLAEKKGVLVMTNDKLPTLPTGRQVTNKVQSLNDKKYYTDEFLRLTNEMAKRQGISSHPDEYYRKMIESLPGEMLKIYVAEYDGPASTRGDDRSSTRGGKIIAANLMIYYGDTATYLHGASGNEHRNLMAPFLLQWQAILDAKKAGYGKYDFGGISTNYLPTGQAGESDTNIPASTREDDRLSTRGGRTTNKNSSWNGITNFKLGFSPNTAPTVFPGSYDIIINPFRYWLYRWIQKIKSFLI